MNDSRSGTYVVVNNNILMASHRYLFTLRLHVLNFLPIAAVINYYQLWITYTLLPCMLLILEILNVTIVDFNWWWSCFLFDR